MENQTCCPQGYYFDELRQGMEAHFSKTITETEIVLITGITGDFNPLHIDAEAAEKTRFHGRIVPGVLTAGLISATLGRFLPGPGSIYVSQYLKFTQPVYPGETLHAYVQIRDLEPDRSRVVLNTRAEVKSKIVAEGESIMIARRRPGNADAG